MLHRLPNQKSNRLHAMSVSVHTTFSTCKVWLFHFLWQLPLYDKTHNQADTMKNWIIRGILIGGSLGVFGALLGFSDSLPRAFGVGMLGGALAGLTLALRNRKKS